MSTNTQETNTQETLHPVVVALRADKAKYLTASVQAEAALGRIVAVMADYPNPDWTTYETWRKEFVAKLPSGVDGNAADKRWSRILKNASVTIPEKPTAAADQKRKQRASLKATVQKMDDKALEQAIQATRNVPGTETVQKAYQKELDRRADELLKPEREALKKRRQEIVKALAKASAADMAKIERILKLG